MSVPLSKYWIHAVVVIGLLIVAMPNLITWFGYSSAMAESDMQAVEWLNEQEVRHVVSGQWIDAGGGALTYYPIWGIGTYTCNEHTAPWIYDRFVDKEYVVEGADFVVVRDEPMTPRCDPENRYYVEGREVDVGGLKLLVEFEGVSIYKGAR